MPLSIWDSPPTVERAPLSVPNDQDDEEEGNFVPYSDVPPSPFSNGGDTPVNRQSNRKASTSRAIVLEEDDEPVVQRKSDYSDEYVDKPRSYEDEYGDLSYSNRAFENIPKRRRYRTSLACAYLRYCSENRIIRRTFQALFFLLVFLIMTFCASAIGYIISREGNPFVSDGNGSVDGNIPKLKPPSPNLYNICSDWVTMSGRKNCQSYCDNALCCSLPETDKNSCWKDNVDDCATYRSACMALELHSSVGKGDNSAGATTETNAVDPVSSTGIGTLSSVVDLPPAPTDLVDICSLSSLSTPAGFTKCSDACRPSRCCNPNVYECQLAKEASKSYCPEYDGPCKSVAETWRGSGHGEVGVDDGNPVANQVMMKCNAANLNPPDTCIEACSPGACCYVSSSYPPIEQIFDKYYGTDQNPMKTTSPCTSNVGFCQQYGSCEHLNHLKDTSGWHSDDYTYEVQIDSVCKSEYIAKNGALSCSNVCQPAHCCFSDRNACSDTQLRDFNCDDYAQCKVLYPTQKNVGELLRLAEHINEVCSDALDSLVARSECQDQCKGHLCCFDDGAYGCSNDATQNCLAYAGCEILIETPQSALQNSNQGNSDQGNSNVLNSSASKPLEQSSDKTIDTNSDPPTTSNPDTSTPDFVKLDEICNEIYMIANGIDACQSLCQPYDCCFTNDGKCDNLSTVTCSRVSPCSNYFTPQEEEVAIEKECSKDAIDKDPDPCLEVCEPYNCCFTDKQCSEHIAPDCNLYTPCKILLDNSPSSHTNPSAITKLDLKQFCSPSNLDKNWNACISHCEPFECCFVQSMTCTASQQSCDENAFCARFFDNGASDASIDPLLDPMQSSTPETSISEATLEEICSPSKLDKNWNACISYCEPYECCFTGSESCDKSKTQCGDYSICARFFAQSVPVLSSSSLDESTSSTVVPKKPSDDDGQDDGPSYLQYTAVELAKACNSKQLSKDDSDCKLLCKGSACCFSSYASSNCFERQKPFCHDHAICESLFDR